MPAFIEVVGTPFYGVPFDVRVGREGLSSNDWVGVYHNGRRLSYHWIRPSKSDLVRFLVSEVPCEELMKVTFQFFADGGYVMQGTRRATLEVRLVNPLRELRVPDTISSSSTVNIGYELLTMVPSGGAKIVVDGVCVAASTRVSTLTGELSLPKPRVAGLYSVVFYGTSESRNGLLSRTMEVLPTGASRFSLHLAPSGADGPFNTGAVAARPGQRLHVQCGGTLARGDDVVLLKCKDMTDFGSPAASAMQMPAAVGSLDVSSGLGSVLLPAEEGLYFVCLGVQQSTGVRLCGAHGLVLLSNKANAAPPAPVEVHVDPAPPASPLTESFSSGRYVCVVCCNNPVNMVLGPCSHLCVCEECCNLLKAHNQPCPMCRGPLRTCTKVFLP